MFAHGVPGPTFQTLHSEENTASTNSNDAFLYALEKPVYRQSWFTSTIYKGIMEQKIGVYVCMPFTLSHTSLFPHIALRHIHTDTNYHSLHLCQGNASVL